jgi:hypothetical protein
VVHIVTFITVTEFLDFIYHLVFHKNRMMNKIQKLKNCINVPSTQTFRCYVTFIVIWSSYYLTNHNHLWPWCQLFVRSLYRHNMPALCSSFIFPSHLTHNSQRSLLCVCAELPRSHLLRSLPEFHSNFLQAQFRIGWSFDVPMEWRDVCRPGDEAAHPPN